MGHPFLAFCAALIFCWLDVSGIPAQERLDAKDLTRILAAARKEHDVPALAGCVVRSDGMRQAAVVGVRKRGAAVAAALTDRWHLGSDTKPITAYLIALLIDMGLLDWNTSLGTIFPEEAKDWPEAMRGITPAHLLCHRSGLPANWMPSWWELENKGSDPRARRAALIRALGKVRLENKPGTTYHYSNLGYTILGAVAEIKGKAAYEDLVDRRIFRPLKMRELGWGPAGRPDGIDQPWPHDAKGKPVVPDRGGDNPSVMNPAGRAHASLENWSRYCAEVLRCARGMKCLAKPATRDRLFTVPFEGGSFYCLAGWAGRPRDSRGKGLFLGHDGSNTFNYCTAALLPDLDLAILVACNQGGNAGRDACWAARDELLKAALGR